MSWQSGLPVGGWSVLRDDPAARRRSRPSSLRRTVSASTSQTPSANTSARTTASATRSRTWAALSSYCRPAEHDLDWRAWARAGFAFLPQAYVNQHGPGLAPAACAAAAAPFVPAAAVHPTVGVYGGAYAPVDHAALLAEAGTIGFSVYPAEASEIAWDAYGAAIAADGIARPPP